MLAVMCAANGLMLLLPFLFGFIHLKVKRQQHAVLIFYRYFVIFNIVLLGIFVAVRVLLSSQMSLSNESPIYSFYAIALIAMVCIALLTVFAKNNLMLAPAFCWFIFIALSTMMRIMQISTAQVIDLGVFWVHAAYNLLVMLLLIGFIFCVKKAIGQLQGVTDVETESV